VPPRHSGPGDARLIQERAAESKNPSPEGFIFANRYKRLVEKLNDYDHATFYDGDMKGYTDYPNARRIAIHAEVAEVEAESHPSKTSRLVFSQHDLSAQEQRLEVNYETTVCECEAHPGAPEGIILS